MALENDLVGDLLERFRRIACGRVSEQQLAQVVREARADWGGRKVYVSATGIKRPRHTRVAARHGAQSTRDVPT